MPYLTDLTAPEMKRLAAEGLPLFAAVGSVELHGSHLPVGTDLFITEGIIREIEKRAPVVIAPSFTFSPTGYAVSGPEDGTADISVSCFIRYAGEVLQNYERMGFKKIYVLVHHQGGNIAALLKTAVLDYSMYSAKNTLGDGWWTRGITHKSAVEIAAAQLDTNAFPGHGGKGETEALMALRPDTVHMDKANPAEYFWTKDVSGADRENAEILIKKVIDAWIEKIG